MKYTICGFSQSVIVEKNLDIYDVYILRWFVDFFSTGKMVHISEPQADGMVKIYSWIKYEAVINDLPCLHITNTRVMARHFDKLVEKKILEKLVKKTVQGTYTYFRVIENQLNDLLSSNNTIVPKSEPIPLEEPPITPSVLNSTDGEENGMNSDATVPKYDMRTVSESTVGTVPKSTTKIPIYQQYSSLRNKGEAAAALELLNVEEECRRTSEQLVFTRDFYEKASCFLRENKLDVAYIPWLFQRNLTKNPRDIRSYFIKTFFAEDIPELYHAQESKKEALTPHDIICPVCSSVHHDDLNSCPVCKLPKDCLENRYEVEYRKWLWSLSDERRNEYQAQCSCLSVESLRTHVKLDDLRNDIARRFGFVFEGG